MTVYADGARCRCPPQAGGLSAWHTPVHARGLFVVTLFWHQRMAWGPWAEWTVHPLGRTRCALCGAARDCSTGPLLAHGALAGPVSEGGMAEFHGYLVARVRAGEVP